MRSDGRYWVALFSQTGSEIARISEKIGRWPDMIITNHRPAHLRTIDDRVWERRNSDSHFRILQNRPSLPSLKQSIGKYTINPIVTLHGWLRIIPPELCNEYEIYNGHPGLITEYPELKGFNPQEKAHKLQLDYSGCVIHKVTEGVDEGEILANSGKIKIKGLSLDRVYNVLKYASEDLWVKFLKERL